MKSMLCCEAQSTPTSVFLSTLQRAFFMGRRKDFDVHVHTHLYVEHAMAELDVPRLGRAFEILVRRHPMLRTWVDAQTRLWVQAGVVAEVDFLDVCDLPEAAQAAALEQRRDAYYRADGDVLAVPNIALGVTRSSQGYRVHISLDLLLLDGSSIRIVLHELSAIYDAIDGDWPEKPLDFDHVSAQMQQLKQSPRYQAMLNYWFERLDSLPPGPQLPLLAYAGAPRRSRLVRRKYVVGTEAWALLAAKAARQGISGTALIFSIFSWVLAYWSKQGHFSVTMLMYQIRNQNMGDLSAAVANFAGTLLMEVERKPQQSFAEFCSAIHGEIFRNATKSLVCGMEVLQERNRQDKSTFRAASPVAFVSMINEPGNPVLPGRFQMEGDYAVAGGLETPQVLMDHQAISRPDGGVALNWDTMDEAFEPGVIDAMFAAYVKVLEQVMEYPAGEGVWQKTHWDLRPEAQQIKHQLYNLTQDVPPPLHLQSLFYQQAAKTPDAVYLRFTRETGSGLEQLTYGQVREQVNHVAWLLREELQLLAGDRVAVYCNKGWQQVVAVLAILAAGGAYVPIDPRQPLARKRDILERCQCVTALTQTQWLGDDALAGLRLVTVDAPVRTGMPDLAPLQHLDDTAYIIFTSGSTGSPKGVTLDHTGPVNSILDINRRIGLTAQDCLFGLSELNFDLSVYDIFGPAAVGGSLLIPPEGAGRDPQRCGQLVLEGGVTVWNSVPALAQLFADYHTGAAEAQVWPLRLFMLSGDWIPLALPEQLKRLGKLDVLSLGGATEASIWSIYYPVQHTRPHWKSIPYGYPMTNQSFWVLDNNLQPRPNQVPGELYIGGIGLAKGYWGDSEKTAQAFITHPITGVRLYKTGDWGVMREAGYIDFLGREDGQVKVRGFRIELGEIEAVLQQHPQVLAAVVKVIGKQPQDAYLAAYVVRQDATHPDALQQHLASRLPAYMLPNRWVFLDALPLSANGKINRNALPDPEPIQHQRSQAAPSTPTEQRLAQLWCEILQRPAVCLGDHFFELGGNSFAAVRLVMALSEHWGRDIPVTQLLEYPLLADLAAALDAPQEQAFNHLVPLYPQEAQGPLAFWFHPSGGNVLCYQALAQALSGRFRLVGVQARPGAAQEDFADFDALVTGYCEALRKAQPQGPYYLGGWSMGGVIAYACAARLLAQGETLGGLWLLDSPGAEVRPVPDASGLLRWFLSDLLQQDQLPQVPSLALANPALPAVVEDIQALGLLPAGRLEGLAAILACFSANIRLLHGYRAEPLHIPVPCLMVVARQQVESRVSARSAALWRDCLPDHTRLVHLDTNHYGVVSAPCVAEYAALIQPLAEARLQDGQRLVPVD